MPAQNELLRDHLCGVFGGTFDPIHYGHLAPLREVFDAAGLAKITYIPAAVPPHRPPPQAAAEHRLAMVRLALAEEQMSGQAGEQAFEVDDIELKRRGPSYTFDTIQSLRRRHPKRRYALIIGLDALLGFETWHRWQALRQGAHLIVMARPEWRMPAAKPSWWQTSRAQSSDELHRTAAGKIFFIETRPVAVSSTQIRARIKAGEDISALATRAVCDYIYQHKLYGE